MNLIDALKTGRNIKRGKNGAWFKASPAFNNNFTIDEILATDWEVEPERYEFECHFESTNHIREVFHKKDIVGEFYKIPLDRRCRVTVEILPDDVKKIEHETSYGANI